MELERVKGSLDKYEFVNHPFVRKYSSMRQFCEEMAKLVESQKSQFTVSSLEDDETRDVVYKSMTDVWGLLAHVFDYNLNHFGKSMDEFGKSFSEFYLGACNEIYYSNQSDKVDEFAEKHGSEIRSLPKMSSLEIIDLIVSSDSFLLKLSQIIQWLRSTLDLNENELKLVKRQLAGHSNEYSVDSSHLKDSKMKQFYKVILRVMKTKGIEEADNIVKSLMSDNCPLSNIFNGGLPFIDADLYQKIAKSLGGEAKKLKKFKILDYMDNSEFQDFNSIKHFYNNDGGAEESSTKKNCMGNSNWLVWQRCLYLSLAASNYTEEQKLFGFLCSDFTFSKAVDEEDYGFDENFYELVRCYFNNEVMRRYIVLRSILQSHDKVSLFNESAEIEEKMAAMSPSEFLEYLYPQSKSHTLYIERTRFIKKISQLLLDENKKFNSIHIILLLNFLTSNEENIEVKQLMDIEAVKKRLRDLPKDFNPELERFFSNQYTLLTSVLATVEDEYFQIGDLQEELLDYVDRYNELLVDSNQNYDVPFFYSQFLDLDQDRVSQKLCGFLVDINDKNTMKVVKEEVKKNFSKNFSSNLFVEATKISSLEQNMESLQGGHDQSVSLDQTTMQDFSGIEWVLDDEKNIVAGLRICLGIFRKMMLAQNWKKASEFNQTYLNKIITTNAQAIRNLNDSSEDRFIKTYVREKQLLTRILDCIAFSRDFISGKIDVNSSRINEFKINIYGVDQHDHNRRKHNELFQALNECLFIGFDYWVFDFIEFVEEKEDSERAKELEVLRLSLIRILLQTIVDMMSICKDAKLQYNQMIFFMKKLRETNSNLLKENSDVVNNTMSQVTNLISSNPLCVLPLIKKN